MCWLPSCRVWWSINIRENHQGPDFPRWWTHSAPPGAIAIQLPIFTGRKAMGLDVLQDGSVIQWKQYWIKHLPPEFYSQFFQVTSSNHLDSVSQNTTSWDTLPKNYLWSTGIVYARICMVVSFSLFCWKIICLCPMQSKLFETNWRNASFHHWERKFWHNFRVDTEALCLFIHSYCNCAGTIPRAELRSVRNP